MIRYIFHVSDIHIMEKNYNNLKHSFLTLVERIVKCGIDISLLVIVGDIFESKSFLNTDDIHQWKVMCSLLKKENIKTLVMIGNHDYNINSTLVRDNVSLLTSYSNIVCVNETQIKDGIIFGDDRLEFYIFSPIDKKIPAILTNNNIKIALLHEPIDFARYDNGELISNSRFKAEDLQGFDYVLLGDIHLHQFITNKIAYCGSFVQKTKGEGINKGYILWDLDSGTGEFFAIPLKEIYLKIEACDDQCELPNVMSNQNIRHLSLFYKNCTAPYITNLKEQLIDKYKYIHRIVNNTAHTIKIDDTVSESKVDNHNDIIKIILKDDINLDNILQHHTDLLRNKNDNAYTTYKLNYLYFENIFCYGSNNYICFNDFKNDLVMINGRNKEGKSSIIDIIIRILFNECVRGYKEDIINKSKSKGFIKLSFNISSDEYIIEQTHSRVSKNQQHRLYKNGENITCDTIINTYKYLRNIIGSYSNFVNMTTALQNRHYLCDMPQKDFISMLTQIMNIYAFEDLEKLTKKEITGLKSLVKRDAEKLQGMTEIKESELIEIKAKMNNLSLKRDELYLNINSINKELIKINRNYNDVNIPENLEEQIYQSKINLGKYQMYENMFDKDINQINNELYFINQKIENISSEKIEKIMDTKYDLKLLDKRSNILAKINECRDITYKPKNNNLRDVKALQSIIDNFDCSIQLKQLENCIIDEEVILDPKDQDDALLETPLPDYKAIQTKITSLEKRIQTHNNNYAALSFNNDCNLCAKNKNCINNIFNIEHEKNKLSDLKNTLSLKEIMQTRYQKAQRYKVDKIQNDILFRNNKIMQFNTNVQRAINEYEAALVEKKEAENENKWKILKRLELQEDIFQEYDIQQQMIRKNKLISFKKYLDAQLINDKLIDLQNIKKENDIKNKQITELSNKETALKKLLESINIDINSASEDYRVKSNKFETYNKLISSHIEYTEKLQFQMSYIKIVNCKTGLPSIILKKTAQILEDKCNTVLKKITDFTIKIIYDNDIKIYTVENDAHIPAQLSSGMQKFVLDLIMRVVLTEISCISCTNMLFIDEGFGSLDKESFCSVAHILQKLKGNFDAMFIISHISELRSYCDLSINISKKGIFSNVQHGHLTVNQKHVKLLTETNINNKRVSDFKSSGKEAKVLKKKETFSKIETFINDNGLENILLRVNNDKIYCLGCEKEYANKKGFAEKHVAGITLKNKHDKYILSLIR